MTTCEKCRGKNPDLFFALQFTWEKNVFRLDPYPILANGDLGPRFTLTEMYPAIHKGGISVGLPVLFFYGDASSSGVAWWNSRQLIALAEEAQKQNMFPEYKPNAYLLHQPTNDPRLRLTKAEAEERGFRERCIIMPVQFFHIDYKVPSEITKHAQLVKDLGL